MVAERRPAADSGQKASGILVGQGTEGGVAFYAAGLVEAVGVGLGQQIAEGVVAKDLVKNCGSASVAQPGLALREPALDPGIGIGLADDEVGG